MITQEIIATLKEVYETDVSPKLIFKVTNAAKEQVAKC